MNQRERKEVIYFLDKGEVKIIKDGYEVSRTALRGAVFGEMSII